MPESVKGLGDLPLLDDKLLRIIDVLVIASSAPSEIRARGSHAMRRRLMDLDYSAAIEVLLPLRYINRDLLAIDRIRYKYSLPVGRSAHTGTTKCDVTDFDAGLPMRMRLHKL
jgi:hypothetical protein